MPLINNLFFYSYISRSMIYFLLKRNTPLGGCSYSEQPHIYFFFLDFLDLFCFISWRAVKIKTKISIKSFIISSISFNVPITLPFQYFVLIYFSSSLCLYYIPFPVLCQGFYKHLFSDFSYFGYCPHCVLWVYYAETEMTAAQGG